MRGTRNRNDGFGKTDPVKTLLQTRGSAFAFSPLSRNPNLKCFRRGACCLTCDIDGFTYYGLPPVIGLALLVL